MARVHLPFLYIFIGWEACLGGWCGVHDQLEDDRGRYGTGPPGKVSAAAVLQRGSHLCVKKNPHSDGGKQSH